MLSRPIASGKPAFSCDFPDRRSARVLRVHFALVVDVYVSDLGSDLTARGERRLTKDNSEVLGITWVPDGESLIYGAGIFREYRCKKDSNS